jgi:transcriptional regulator with XRE-family HTH domain
MAKKPRSLSGFLKGARTHSGLSQREVSLRLGYTSPQFISNWERGISSPPCRTLRKLGDLYKVPAQDLYEILLEDTLKRTEQSLRREFFSSK